MDQVEGASNLKYAATITIRDVKIEQNSNKVMLPRMLTQTHCWLSKLCLKSLQN
jgi:hypothetical protein